MCVRVRACVDMCICVCVCLYFCAYVCRRVCTRMRSLKCVCVCVFSMRVCALVCPCAHVHMHLWMQLRNLLIAKFEGSNECEHIAERISICYAYVGMYMYIYKRISHSHTLAKSTLIVHTIHKYVIETENHTLKYK